MSRFDGFTEDVLDALAPLGDVRARAMFGGVGIRARELFFALIADGELFLKVDDVTRERHRAAGAHAFAPFEAKPAMNGYWSVPVDVLEDPRTLLSWAASALEVAANARSKPKSPSRKPSRRRER